jgi:hypothetical protein
MIHPASFSEAIIICGMRNPKEAWKMVSNLSETLKKAYDDAVIMGAEQTKQEIVLNMLGKNMDEKIISEITGLSIDKIRTIKQDNPNKLH